MKYERRDLGQASVSVENSLEDTRESRTTLDIATNRFFQLQLESTGPISQPIFSFASFQPSASFAPLHTAYTFICSLDRLPLYLPIYLRHSLFHLIPFFVPAFAARFCVSRSKHAHPPMIRPDLSNRVINSRGQILVERLYSFEPKKIFQMIVQRREYFNDLIVPGMCCQDQSSE